MTKWRLWTGISLVFLSGLIIGAVGTGVYIKKSITGVLQGGPPAVKGVLVKRLAGELDLTGNQKSEIEKIVGEAQARLLSLRLQHQPEIEEIIERSLSRMKTKLSNEQQLKLDRIHERLKKNWHIPEPKNGS